MMLSFDAYLKDRAKFAIQRAQVQQVLDEAQPLAIEALGIHTARQVLWDGRLPAYPVMTTAEMNAGWGELMPVWFKPYERPVPFYCLDNWALFAGLYREAFGSNVEAEYLTSENLLRVVLSADLLVPFLPTTQGAGRFLRHGALTILLGIIWLESPAREAWLSYHAHGARSLVAEMPHLANEADLDTWLTRIENDAFLVPEQTTVAGDVAVKEFLCSTSHYQTYLGLLRGLCLSVAALAQHYGLYWRAWIFQAVNVHYRMPEFGLENIQNWIEQY